MSGYSQSQLASGDKPKLSIVIPALDEASSLAVLLPELRTVLEDLRIRFEVLVITDKADALTKEIGMRNGASIIEQVAPGYAGALLTGFAKAAGEYILTMDADLSHPPDSIPVLWENRSRGQIIVASRYAPGGRTEMPMVRLLLSKVLNQLYRRVFRLALRDLSSGFRLYSATVVRGQSFAAQHFNILQEILITAHYRGHAIEEIPFRYGPRVHGKSHVRIIRFGLAHLHTLWRLFWPRTGV